jgi:ABC-type multidrug transport system fused ATPase/permease subunit
VADMVMNGAAAAAGVLAAFYHSPTLAAILLSCVPLIGVPSALMAKFISRSSMTVQQRYSSAGAAAHEVGTSAMSSTTATCTYLACTRTMLTYSTCRCLLVSGLWLHCAQSDSK